MKYNSRIMILFKHTSLILILSVLCSIFSSCQNYINKYRKISGYTQGTTYNITYKDALGRNFQKEIEDRLQQFDMNFSAYIHESVISRINRNDPDVELTEDFILLFHKAKEVYENTQGAFDITVGPLVNAWGFGWEHDHPDSVNIDSLLQFIGMDKVHIEDEKLVKSHPGIVLDVNAIAQGYSADIISAFLESKKIHNYLVEIGGEIHAKGVNPKGVYWRVGIDKPIENNVSLEREIQSVVNMQDNSLATSGNYRKFYEKDGIKYAHSIDPKTGYPILSNLLSATVLTNDCITADAYATAFMVMGLDKSIEYIEKHKNIEAYLIYSDKEGNYQVYMTKYFKENSYNIK